MWILGLAGLIHRKSSVLNLILLVIPYNAEIHHRLQCFLHQICHLKTAKFYKNWNFIDWITYDTKK